MILKVTTSSGGFPHYRLWIEGAPMILLTILNSEGLSRSYDIDSLRVNISALSPIELSLYKKWDGKFATQLEKVHDEESSELYARYFISAFSPVFSCAYSVDYDVIVLLWNKLNNFKGSCSNSCFNNSLKILFDEFLSLLSENFGELKRYSLESEELDLFEETSEAVAKSGSFYSRSYSASLNAIGLSVELCPSIHYDISEAPNPQEDMFYAPHILDDDFHLLLEYYQDMAYEARNGLWPSAMYVTVIETGIVESLMQKTADAQQYRSTRIEIPELCAATIKLCRLSRAV